MVRAPTGGGGEGPRHVFVSFLLLQEECPRRSLREGETFVEILGAHWHQRRRQLTERLPHRGGARHVAGLAVSAAWGLVARIFAFAPGPPARAGPAISPVVVVKRV